jgi:hypothetical protein
MTTRRLGPFVRIAGSSLIRPPTLATAQTDGSWKEAWRLSRTAVILKTDENEIYKSMWTYTDGEHLSSTESEWGSVVHGILLALKKDQGALSLENDNLSVIQAIQGKKAMKGMKHYMDHIYELTAPLEWFGIRWIPRGLNKADSLFRI